MATWMGAELTRSTAEIGWLQQIWISKKRHFYLHPKSPLAWGKGHWGQFGTNDGWPNSHRLIRRFSKAAFVSIKRSWKLQEFALFWRTQISGLLLFARWVQRRSPKKPYSKERCVKKCLKFFNRNNTMNGRKQTQLFIAKLAWWLPEYSINRQVWRVNAATIAIERMRMSRNRWLRPFSHSELHSKTNVRRILSANQCEFKTHASLYVHY